MSAIQQFETTPSKIPEESRGRSLKRAKDNSLSLWSDEPKKVVFFEEGKPIYTIISNALTPEQINAAQELIRIDEITKLLSPLNHDLFDRQIIDSKDRSPSPPPTYDINGKRVNTREFRYRKKFQVERNKLITSALKTIPNFKPPIDYKKPIKTVEKLYIPVDDYPQINFIGLLLGPRGNNLKQMQEESGARIGIRGKGSVKEGKNTNNLKPEVNNLEDKLHCLITSESEEKIIAAKKLCQQVIDKAIYAPVGQNDLKREQLKQLAILNGTLRLDEDRICNICGGRGHKRYDCPNVDEFGNSLQNNYINSIVCNKCGNVGHLSRDCKANLEENEKIDREFENMMKDLTGEDSQLEGNKTLPAPLAATSNLEQQQIEPSKYQSSPELVVSQGSSYKDGYGQQQQYHHQSHYNNHNGYQQRSSYNQPYNSQYSADNNHNNQHSYNNYNSGYNNYKKRPYYNEDAVNQSYGYDKQPTLSSFDQRQPYPGRQPLPASLPSLNYQHSHHPQQAPVPEYKKQKFGSASPPPAHPAYSPPPSSSSYQLRGPPGLHVEAPPPLPSNNQQQPSNLSSSTSSVVGPPPGMSKIQPQQPPPPLNLRQHRVQPPPPPSFKK